EMARRGTPFQGLLYAGLALTSRGVRVVEFNARFGDPETQPLLALLDASAGPGLGTLLLAAAECRLHETLQRTGPPRWLDAAAVAVVLASRGYPASSSRGDLITGIADAEALEGVSVLHAGTALAGGGPADGTFSDGPLVTAGGRVLAVVGVGPSVAEARARAYAGASKIDFPGKQLRTDIAAAAAGSAAD
ncbi:MAG TPA: phosphoribosylglycinamide synthetase C domain-containing protein, partial [Actinomycetales bacterium]|nr:phosphoribosylglycinamide synthetase C domain-containing protein [Actinomycetales bacterium]